MIIVLSIFRYYQIVVMEQTSLSNSSKLPSQYTLNELGPYNKASYRPGLPYIAAEISSSSFSSIFSIGDGKAYSRFDRKRRSNSPVKYRNVALKPETEYSAFQRVFVSEVSGIPLISFIPIFIRNGKKR